MSRLILLGAGGIAIVVADIARRRGFDIAGFLDDAYAERHGTEFAGARILGDFGLLSQLRNAGIDNAVVAIGNCVVRLQLFEEVRLAGFELPSLIHPSAIVADDTSIGLGTILMAGTIVNSGSQVGASVIVNTAASIDHDCVIGEGVHIAPGVRLSGRVTVGRNSWIGIGSIVREGIRIGAGSMIGAGSLVLKDIPDGVVAYGSPAKVIRMQSETSGQRPGNSPFLQGPEK